MENVERKLASELLRIKAVLLRPGEPFTWASGWRSPIYCDNRRILGDPALRGKVASWLAGRARELFPEAETVAGVATGAIAHGALVADRLGKPFVYVRPKPKDHGTGSRIEGMLAPGSPTVVVEDLVSTGMSSLEAVKALREAGARVLGMVAIFSYRFPEAEERFASEEVTLSTLSNYGALLEEACESGFIEPSDMDVLRQWRADPAGWMR
jgi:orotate phosphoribosyltransferase